MTSTLLVRILYMLNYLQKSSPLQNKHDPVIKTRKTSLITEAALRLEVGTQMSEWEAQQFLWAVSVWSPSIVWCPLHASRGMMVVLKSVRCKKKRKEKKHQLQGLTLGLNHCQQVDLCFFIWFCRMWSLNLINRSSSHEHTMVMRQLPSTHFSCTLVSFLSMSKLSWVAPSCLFSV